MSRTGTADIYHSRRTHYYKCFYWLRDEDGINDSEAYIYNKEPDGMFDAKLLGSEQNDYQAISDSFMAANYRVTLFTTADINDLHENCIVKFDGYIWRVEDLQKQVHNKESQFNKHLDYNWYIKLRR